MQNKISLEEHFATPDTIGDSEDYFTADIWPERRRQLLDLQSERIERMDACGIAYTILSLNAPAVQAITDTRRAIDVARRANDLLAEQVARRPDRSGAFAALPMQDPGAAGCELERAVSKLYPAQVTTRKFFGSMTRKLSVTEARNSGHRLGTCSRRKPRTASVNSR